MRFAFLTTPSPPDSILAARALDARPTDQRQCAVQP